MSRSQSEKRPFALSQLMYDKRYRAITLQVIAGLLIVGCFWWLGANIVANLMALGKDFNFSYLGTRAGYDINQKLIEYNNLMSHGRAALVGIMNTLLVCALGCVTATIIGIFAGVLRLSKNWIVHRLMAIYVEAFRNVPLLLWIVLIFAVLTEALPQPKEFRGAEATAHMQLFDTVAVTGRGTYVPRIAFTHSISGHQPVAPQEGAALVASGWQDWALIFVVFAVGLGVARHLGVWATKIQEKSGARPLIWPWQWAIVVVPLATVLGVLGATIVSPYLKGFNFTEGVFLRNSLIALWLALSLYRGAFIAEIVRSGILAISKGQSEAAAALGLQPSQILKLVILPQAKRIIIPPLISQYLGLVKDSSLALAVGYMDVRATLGGITINQTGRELEGMLLLGLFYLAISLVIAFVINMYNRLTRIVER